MRISNINPLISPILLKIACGLLIIYQLLRQSFQIRIDQLDQTVHSVASSPVKKILPGKLVGPEYHFIHKFADQTAVFFHITDIHMLRNTVALRCNVRKKHVHFCLQIRIRDALASVNLKEPSPCTFLIGYRYLCNLCYMI